MLIVDGSNLLHRVLHTEQGTLQAYDGTPTGGIHGVLSALSHSIRNVKYLDSIVVAWDNGVPIHRRELDRNYKPSKNITSDGKVPDYLLPTETKVDTFSESSEEFLKKYRYSRDILNDEILPKLGCISLLVNNCEADDIISYICNKVSGVQPNSFLLISTRVGWRMRRSDA